MSSLSDCSKWSAWGWTQCDYNRCLWSWSRCCLPWLGSQSACHWACPRTGWFVHWVHLDWYMISSSLGLPLHHIEVIVKSAGHIKVVIGQKYICLPCSFMSQNKKNWTLKTQKLTPSKTWNEIVVYNLTCAVEIWHCITLCTVRCLCGDFKAVVGARLQVIDSILSFDCCVTVGPILASPCHNVTIAFLVITRSLPRDCHALLLCLSHHKWLHT